MNSSASRIKDAWRAACVPPDRREIYDWAADHVRLPIGFVRPGEFSVDHSRWLIEPFHALADDTIHDITLVKPVQGGGTLVGDIWLAWCIANRPGPFLWLMQSDETAKRHAETRTSLILKSCQPVLSLLPPNPYKKSIQETIFTNGMYLGVSGPGINKLQSIGIMNLFLDEIWLPAWQGRVTDAIARTKAFAEQRLQTVFCVSQAGFEDDVLHERFIAGTQEEWQIVCESCSHNMTPKWSNIRPDGSRWGVVWDKKESENGEPFGLQRALETVRFECEKCGFAHADKDRTRREWNRNGFYLRKNFGAQPGNRSFHWPAFAHRRLADLVIEFHSAMSRFSKGSITGLQQFLQKEIGEFWSENQIFDAQSISTESYDVKSDWCDEHVRFLTVDRQAEGLHYWVVRAWALNGESRRIDFGQSIGGDSIDVIREKWTVDPKRTFIDSGFEARSVYSLCAARGFTALKGESGRDAYFHKVRFNGKQETVRRPFSKIERADPGIGTRDQGKRFAPLMLFSDTVIQSTLDRLIKGKGARWSCSEIKSPSEEKDYKDQLFSEVLKRKPDSATGRDRLVWQQIRRDNHYRDCEKMQVVAAMVHGLILDDNRPKDVENITES